MAPLSRRAFAVGTLAALAGCTGLSGSLSGSRSAGRTDPTAEDSGDSSSSASPKSADGTGPPLADRRLYVPFEPASLREQVLSGGPGEDGIPAIDEPTFVPAGEAPSALGPESPVFGLAHEGAIKAYPQYVLVWHEIVNDTLGRTPVSVTYCPLTGTAMGFERGGTTFGVSGKLVNSNLLMYDRATDSRWPQMLATAISGPLLGESLREFPLAWSSWQQWREAYPETLVLTEDTGYVRDYGTDPYGSYAPPEGYYADRGTLFAPLHEDDRYHPKDVVLGTRTTDGALAFYGPALRREGLLEGTVPGDDTGAHLLAAYHPALDAASVYHNPEELTFEYREGTVLGPDGERYAPDSLPLEAMVGYDAMWFAWAGFYPNTAVIERS